ncbi:carbohydrate sulfotransferase 8 [Biomphalaria glabrata]|nr:carbohydrate sulfotransferase 8 [Biomphalaria glabrata]
MGNFLTLYPLGDNQIVFMKNRNRKDSNDRLLPQVQLDTEHIKKKLRRCRYLKKIIYAATILFITIIIYASTSSEEYIQETNKDWQLPLVAHNNYPVDARLYEPLTRLPILPLGPFKEDQPPVVIESGEHPVNAESAHAAAVLNKVVRSLPEVAANISKLGPPGLVNRSAAVSVQGPPAVPVPQPIVSNHIVAKPTSRAPIGHAQQSGPSKPLPDLVKVSEEVARRLNHTKIMCDFLKVPNKVDSDIYYLPQYNLSYCKVPKAACTYWEQMFSFLNKVSHEIAQLGIRSPFQISKYDIRYTSHLNLPRKSFRSEEDQADILKTTRVLFVRHPLERLWSCYLEKFFLIDFWTSAGIAMKTSGAETKCPKSITFREFVEYTLPLYNEHWAPVTELCNPCIFQPNIIGHVETIRDDTHLILRQSKLDWIVSEQEKISREENQMLDTIIYNYQIHSINWYSFYHKCLSQKELATKLWVVFKKVGYLSSHAVLPETLSDYNQTTIILELKSQFRKFPLSSANGRAQQLKMLKRDYDALPKPLMAKILEKYNTDFLLFGYNASLPTS